MSDKPDPKQSDLVPAAKKALTTRFSALVRRGLNDLSAVDEYLDVTPLSLRVESADGSTIVYPCKARVRRSEVESSAHRSLPTRPINWHIPSI
jgi:hypothetical protein